MTPEQARRIMAQFNFNKRVDDEPEHHVTYDRSIHGLMYTTVDVAKMIDSPNTQVVRDCLTKRGAIGVKMISPKNRHLMFYWKPRDVKAFVKSYKGIRQPLFEDIEWITASEAMSILNCTRSWLHRNASYINRVVNGVKKSFFDKQQIISLKNNG